MNVNILIFGQLSDIIGTGRLILNEVPDTDNLIRNLHSRYPDLADVEYVCAVDQKVISENTPLEDKSTVALLPPFSGG